jgi:hypothetical protein
MKESCGKDPASHPDPESCVGGRKGAGEALTGAHAGQPSSCDRGTRRPAIELRNQVLRGADAVKRRGRPHRGRRHLRVVPGPRAVGDPVHAWKLSARETGDPTGTHRSNGGSAGKGPRPYCRPARPWEVGRSRRTGEAAEQGCAHDTCGGGGGKAIGQGEHADEGHVPDAEPDRRDVRSTA